MYYVGKSLALPYGNTYIDFEKSPNWDFRIFPNVLGIFLGTS
jgi:hypothetical protein